MDQSHKLLLVGLAAVLLVGATVTIFFVGNRDNTDTSSDIATALIGSAERPAVFTNINGEEIKLSISENRERIIYTWASWSPFSKDDLMLLDELAKNYPHIRFIALNRAESTYNAQRFLNTLSELPNVEIVIDTNDTFYQAVGGYAVPETLIYDRDGALVLHHRGTLDKEALVTVLDEF